MRVSLKSVFAGLALSAIASTASAGTVNLTSTVGESGFVGLQTGGSYPLTATPYNFTGQVNFAGITNIDQLTVTLQISDGDTAPGDYDFNNLFLTLDGLNTGLALNGFPNNTNFSLTLSQIPSTLQATLIAALQDGLLVGGVLDTDADVPVVGDTIAFPLLVDTTLDLVVSGPNIPGGGPNPVPVPAALLLAPMAAGLAGAYSRRFRRAK